MTELLVGDGWADYALLDSGAERKLERYGRYRIARPERQALWAPAAAKWDPDAEFVPGADDDGGGRWQLHRTLPASGWRTQWHELSFAATLTPFRHLGFFPDMMPVWSYARSRLAPLGDSDALNLFGYTGIGSLALARAGARVVHVDASKKSVEAARNNAAMSGMSGAPIRWLVDDAAKFVARDVRRGRRYDGVILDPPKYGRGPEGEVWRLDSDLAPLLALVAQLVDARSSFVFLTVYAVDLSPTALGNVMTAAFARHGGRVVAGELGVREEARGLVLPTALWARWES